MAKLLTDADAAKVAEHVAAAERSTAGEIVVVVAERSAEYGAPRSAFSFAVTLLVAVAVYVLVPAIPGLWVLTGQVPLWLLVWWLSGQRSLLRWLVPRAEQATSVEGRARQLFVEQGVTETRQRSGVLLYISELEHRVELVADRGIHERVGKEAWQATVDTVVAAIREGKPATGIIAAVDSIGASLSRHFPPDADDVNELPDALRRV